MSSIESLAAILEQSLLPAHAREAEKQLKSIETQPGFPVSMLQLISSSQLPFPVRQAGAVFFKNLIRRKWTNEEGQHLFAENDVQYIKSNIVDTMIVLAPALQLQISESISMIAESDFPHNWGGLIDELVNKFSTTDFSQNKAILVVAHSIFKKWRPLYSSNELFLEIKHVLDKFAQPFLMLLEKVDQQLDISLAANDKANSIIYLENLLSLAQIYFDLNCQDIPEFFEDNMVKGMSILHKYLALESDMITDASEDEEVDILIKCKTSIVELVSLYISRYADVFEPLVENFITTIWKSITTYATKQSKFDLLVVNSLKVLSSVTRMHNYQGMFNSEGAIKEIIEKIILPNIYFRDIDEELFEDEPIQYVRSDLEGSDFDTRRKSATDFLRELKLVNSELVTSTVMTYVNEFKVKGDWKNKDVAIYLFSALAAKGTITNIGVTSTNELVNVVQFFTDNIATDLSNVSAHPILKTDAIKYILIFRNQLTKQQLLETFPLLFTHLQDSNPVVYTYTAITIEKLLAMNTFTTENKPVFTKEDIQPFAKDLLCHLFNLILQNQQSPEKLSENEFLIQCIMRVLSTAEDTITMDLKISMVNQLLSILKIISSNPSNPRFSHYIFEALGFLIKYNTQGQIDLIVPSLLEILGNDVQEFVPYIFQILAFLLEVYDKSEPLPTTYNQIIKPLLSPAVWEFRGNVPGVTRLIIAILDHDASSTFGANQESLTALLGVFQKLISSRVHDIHGFDLLESILINIPLKLLTNYLNQIAILLLTRLKNHRVEKFTQRFVIFFLSLACIPLNEKLNIKTNGNINGEFVVNFIDSAQKGVFSQIFTSFILPQATDVKIIKNRKILIMGLVKLLEAPQFQADYQNLLAPALEKLTNRVQALKMEPKEINALINDGVDRSKPALALQSTVNELDFESATFGSSFSKIISIKPANFDPLPNLDDWNVDALYTTASSEITRNLIR